MDRNYELSMPVSERDHMQGNASAKIVLVEYGDYQCPYCGRAYPIVKQLQEDFGDQLAFVFRNFPLSQMHEHAMNAAQAAEIASDYNKFWPMHDLIYENQANLDDLSLMRYASSLGIDGTEFMKKMDHNEKEARVKEDFMSGVDSGVNGTPSFFINGVKYGGDWSYAPFKELITSLIGE